MSLYFAQWSLYNSVPSSRSVIHSEPLLNVNVCRNFGLEIHFWTSCLMLATYRNRLSVIEYTKGKVIKWPVKRYVRFFVFTFLLKMQKNMTFYVFLVAAHIFLEHCLRKPQLYRRKRRRNRIDRNQNVNLPQDNLSLLPRRKSKLQHGLQWIVLA